jgi:hypothetical protein
VTGTFAGMTLNVQSAIAGTTTGALFGSALPNVVVTEIGLSSVANACNLVASTGVGGFRNSQTLSMALASNGSPAPGTYEIVYSGNGVDASTTAPAVAANATINVWDATCNESVDEVALRGSIVVTRATSTEIAGTYDLMFGSLSDLGDAAASDHLTGSFDATYCAPLTTKLGMPDAGAAPCN